MSLKWTGSETGILRKSEFKEKKEELFVFGYSCKLFREDDKALLIDQGKHLIPWMGDETLKIDRYDARGALHELSSHEAPPGGYDWRVELTRSELEVEQLCDEERYRALHTNEDEEEMYKEEELKRLHAAGYGQVGFNYNEPAAEPVTSQTTEIDEPFTPTPDFAVLLPIDIVFPETQKQNAIIEKTAKFIANQGAQMEILIKAKQRDNPQFKFLNKEDVLNPYYTALIGLVKAGKWPEKKADIVEEKPQEPDEYLHPSLASTVIESAPSIPSIQYKPSADCDYTLLITKMRGSPPEDLPPPGTEPPPAQHEYPHSESLHTALPQPHISRAPVMYNTLAPPLEQPVQQYAAYYAPPPAPPPKATPIDPHLNSTGLSLMKNYASGSDSESESEPEYPSPKIPTPPQEVEVVISKMAAYVARNGDEFAEIVRAKCDPRFTFLEPTNEYHQYYLKLMREKRAVNGTNDKVNKAPVSFSIKKQKEPDPILPKPALPYESSSEDEEQIDKQETTQQQPINKEEQKTETQEIKIETLEVKKNEKLEVKKNEKLEVKKIEKLVVKKNEKLEVKKIEKKEEIPKPIYTINNLPPVVVYKMEGQLTHNLPTITTIETVIPPKVSAPKSDIKPLTVLPIERKIEEIPQEKPLESKMSPPKERPEKERDKDNSHKREKKRRKDKKDHKDKEYYKSERDGRHSKSSERDRDRRKERDRHDEKEIKKKRRKSDNLENEIINLEENNSDELIDLTGDLSDRGDFDPEVEKAKQIERRRRAAEFLKKVGVDPTAAVTLPTNSLASAMVDTLETIRKKKAAEEEKRRRKEKKRRRDKREYEEADKAHRKNRRRKYKSSGDDDSDGEGKKKKRKKDKKAPKINKKKRTTPEPSPEEPPIDISNTLKELRTNSPTKNLMMNSSPLGKKKREYSEGEWSTDSDEDSLSTCTE